jgi:hypothetical protein
MLEVSYWERVTRRSGQWLLLSPGKLLTTLATYQQHCHVRKRAPALRLGRSTLLDGSASALAYPTTGLTGNGMKFRGRVGYWSLNVG